MFKPTASGKDSMNDADYASIKSMQALAAELSIAILVVHHTRKSNDQVDPFEKVSGTLGLSGAADSTLIPSRDQNGSRSTGAGGIFLKSKPPSSSIVRRANGGLWAKRPKCAALTSGPQS
jgi:hypothetical protein